MPALEPFSLAVVYTLRAPNDLAGIVTAAPESGVDHVSFWTLRLAANEDELQLFGRSLEIDPLDIVLPHGGDAHIAIWTMEGGSAELIDAAGSETDTYDGAFGTPAEIVLGGRYDGGPFGFAEIDVMATLGRRLPVQVAQLRRVGADGEQSILHLGRIDPPDIDRVDLQRLAQQLHLSIGRREILEREVLFVIDIGC